MPDDLLQVLRVIKSLVPGIGRPGSGRSTENSRSTKSRTYESPFGDLLKVLRVGLRAVFIEVGLVRRGRVLG
jgi:hypothetical protein